jgi:putative spermidine/putrescine transport system ATP-binding protein
VLTDVSFQVDRGQFLTVLGPSGSGKTTLLSVLAGFVRASAGSISFDGVPIGELAPEKCDFGMVFQGYALFPHLSLADNVAFPLRVRRWPAAQIAEAVEKALDAVHLRGFAHRLPTAVSGGQQQRAALARALVFKPRVVLLDEPLSALDRSLRSEMQAEISELHRRFGLTVVYVTHDQTEALSMSDQIVILRDGRLVQKGTPQELYERPASPFAARFLGQSNFIRGAVLARVGEDLFYESAGRRLLHRGDAGGAGLPGEPVLLAVRPEKVRIGAMAEAMANSLAGEIVSINYLGESYSVTVEVEGIGRLVGRAMSNGPLMSPGSRVAVGWDCGSSIVIEADADAAGRDEDPGIPAESPR